MEVNHTATRDWSKYNEQMVKRGEILLEVKSLKNWQKELKQMNQGKRGKPFLYSESLVLFLGTLRVVFSLPYRQLEGLARGLGKLMNIPAPDYSTLSLRIPNLELDIDEPANRNKEVVVAVDATGVKVTDRGEWMKGRKKKGYVKIHVAVDIESKQVISLEVTDDKTHDSQKLGELIDKGGKRVRIKKVLGDGGYDTKENFDLLQREGIEPGIKVRENSKDGSSGARGKVVQEYLASKAKWKEKIGYGKRWIVESFFSAFKRMFGEVVRNKRWERILKEIELKVYIYNLMLNVEPG